MIMTTKTKTHTGKAAAETAAETETVEEETSVEVIDASWTSSDWTSGGWRSQPQEPVVHRLSEADMAARRENASLPSDSSAEA
jgi:hypothetical protein